jgi:hypothetical protein
MSRGCDCGERPCLCAAAADGVAWKEWKDLGGTQTFGFCVKDVTDIVTGAWRGDGDGVDLSVHVAAAVFAGSQPRRSVGWYTTLLLAVPNEERVKGAIPNGIVTEFPLAFGNMNARGAFCFPLGSVLAPCRVVSVESQCVSRDRAKRWKHGVSLPAGQADWGTGGLVACVVFMMQDCMGGTLGMEVSALGRGA